MDVIDKFEKRQEELLDELEKTNPADPNYKYISDNLKTITDTKTNALKEDNTRLNNNEANDIDRMRVEVDMQRNKTERLKIGAGLVGDVTDLVKCCGFAWIAYNGDKVSYAVKEVIGIARGFLRQKRH